MVEQDRQSIGLTAAGQTWIEDIQGKGWFIDAQDVARFAFAYAVAVDVKPTSGGEKVDTRWAIGNFDSTGEIMTLVRAIRPDTTTPVRDIEYLVNVGLGLIHERLVRRGETPDSLMGN